MNNRILTAEAAAQFRHGINLVLFRWSALRMAIENEWGDRDSVQKSHQLGDNIFNRLAKSKEQVYDVEGLLKDFIKFSLNTKTKDGSIKEVSLKLMKMHEECLQGNFDSIKRLQETKIPTLSYVRPLCSDDDEDSEEDDDSSVGNNSWEMDSEEEDDDSSIGDNSSDMEVDPPQCQSNLSRKAATASSESSVKEVPEVEDRWTVVRFRRSKVRKKLGVLRC